MRRYTRPRSLQSTGMLKKSDFNRYLEYTIHRWLHRHRPDALPGWMYPVVFQLDSGQIQNDLSHGKWREQCELDRFLEECGAEKANSQDGKKGAPLLSSQLYDWLALQIGYHGSAFRIPFMCREDLTSPSPAPKRERTFCRSKAPTRIHPTQVLPAVKDSAESLRELLHVFQREMASPHIFAEALDIEEHTVGPKRPRQPESSERLRRLLRHRLFHWGVKVLIVACGATAE